MTVTYSAEVATCRGLGNFHRLLRRWTGSIYKLVWFDLLIWSILYTIISLVFRLYFNVHASEYARNCFIQVFLYCDKFGSLIPLSFVLGFYVSTIVGRWWSQFMLLPWPDNIATLISTNIQGNDDRGRLMRRTIMRYLNLSFVMTMSLMSTAAKRRFPSLDQMVESGFLLVHEKLIIENMNKKTSYSKYWVPIIWAGGIVSRARREGRLADDVSMNMILNQLVVWRSGLGDLLGFDWATVPLMYTQVVTMAVYAYFVAALFGKQFYDPSKLDLYVPLFTIVEFFFYIGWLKVAETLINPFGDDDDDFEISWLIDRNLLISYMIVDEMHAEHPPLLKDQHWDADGPLEIPYTDAVIRALGFEKSTSITDPEDDHPGRSLSQ